MNKLGEFILMKNNLKALGLHLIIVVLSIMFLIVFVATGPLIGRYSTNIVSRLFISITFIFAYIFAGTLLDITKNKKYDFLVGFLLGILGVALWFYTFSITDKNLFEIPKELSGYWILNNFYNTPLIIISFLLEVPSKPLSLLMINLLPSLLMGFGLKYKRFKSEGELQ